MKKSLLKAIFDTGKILDAWLPNKIQYEHIPGLSVGIFYNGKLVYKKGFGYADIELRKKATPETCYRIASISKTFTAISILQLAEQRKLNLDDHIEKYLPWFRAKNKNNNSKNITIEQLLSHTSGVFRDGITPHWVNDKFPDIAQLRKSASDKSIIFENLTRFKYSNFGYGLLGEIMKQVTGASYEKYVDQHIIRKLSLKNTFPDFSEEIRSKLAKGYGRIIPHQKREYFHPIKTNAFAPATGYISNVLDLAEYLSALSLSSKSKKTILARESKKKMAKEYFQSTEEGEFYGLGLRIYKIDKRKIVGHGGSFAGYATALSLDVENDIGVITLSNTIKSKAGRINKSIFESIYDLIDSANKYNGNKKIINAERYEGVYRSRWNDSIIIGLKNALVAFDSNNDSPLKQKVLLKPAGKDQFLIESKSNFDSPGEIAKFIFNKGSKKSKKLLWGATPSTRIY